jgi:two-component system LytT family response regulator
MMNVIIVDDEQAGRRTLRELCEAEGDLCVIGEYGEGRAALAEIRAKRPQLLFLDIQMDPLNGIDLARALAPDELPTLVFVTAYDTYALEAFEVCAVDYLLKPFDQERWLAYARAIWQAPQQTARRCSPACSRNWSAARARRPKIARACSRNSTVACT